MKEDEQLVLLDSIKNHLKRRIYADHIRIDKHQGAAGGIFYVEFGWNWEMVAPDNFTTSLNAFVEKITNSIFDERINSLRIELQHARLEIEHKKNLERDWENLFWRNEREIKRLNSELNKAKRELKKVK